MAENREKYEEKLDLLMREAIAETETTLGTGKRGAPVFWRMAREGFLRRLCAAPDTVALLRVLFGDETIGIKTRPLFDRLMRAAPIATNGGGGTSMTMPEGQTAPVSPPLPQSEGVEASASVSEDQARPASSSSDATTRSEAPPESEGVEARTRVSEDQRVAASSSSDTDTLWEPKAPPKSPPRPDPSERLKIERRVYSDFPIDDDGKKIDIRDLPVHRLKRLSDRFARGAIWNALQFNVVRPHLDYVERQASVPSGALVRNIVPPDVGQCIIERARQRAEGMLFLLPKGMRVPLRLHDD